MKRSLFAIAFVCLVLLTPSVSCGAAVLESEQPITIWHIPHPDDETLAMAGGISAAALAGHRNIVVLYTGGESSVVRLGLNVQAVAARCGDGGMGIPAGHRPLSAADFARARVKEARAALVVLGVAAEDIIEVHLRDGAIDPQEALAVMRDLHARFPHADHRTTSIYDGHVDHRNLARALFLLQDEVQEAGGQLDVGFYRVYVYNWPAEKRAPKGVQKVPVAKPDVKRQALAEFGVWEPEQGRFAIGLRSVPRLFAAAAADPYEYMDIVPPEGPSAFARLGDLGVVLFNDGLGLAYRTHPRWQWRVENPFRALAPSLSVVHNTPPQAYGVRMYGGIGVVPFGSAPTLALFGGVDLMQRVLVEYSVHPHMRRWRLGYHFLY